MDPGSPSIDAGSSSFDTGLMNPFNSDSDSVFSHTGFLNSDVEMIESFDSDLASTTSESDLSEIESNSNLSDSDSNYVSVYTGSASLDVDMVESADSDLESTVSESDYSESDSESEMDPESDCLEQFDLVFDEHGVPITRLEYGDVPFDSGFDSEMDIAVFDSTLNEEDAILESAPTTPRLMTSPETPDTLDLSNTLNDSSEGEEGSDTLVGSPDNVSRAPTLDGFGLFEDGDEPDETLASTPEDNDASPTIDEFPKIDLAGLSKAGTCPICMSPYISTEGPIIKTPCDHIFCHCCFMAWLKPEGRIENRTCPSCRSVILAKPIHNPFHNIYEPMADGPSTLLQYRGYLSLSADRHGFPRSPSLL